MPAFAKPTARSLRLADGSLHNVSVSLWLACQP